jgi:hypothetical protein
MKSCVRDKQFAIATKYSYPSVIISICWITFVFKYRANIAFRPGSWYDTTLKNNIENFNKYRRKTLYCAFIDYRKACDSVDRILLWQKLLRTSIVNYNTKYL